MFFKGTGSPGGSAYILVELLVAILLISMTMATIATTYARTAKILRASREIAAASQVLQQRIEMVRARPWTELASSRNLAAVMGIPTDSEAELADTGLVETIRATVPKSSSSGLVETDQYFALTRREGSASVDQAGEFLSEPTLLLEGSVTWKGSYGVRHRYLRTVISRNGLTRSGIVGTVLGRPGTHTPRTP
jgi:type II secretory pathway pseudopilin PulG